MHDHQDPAPGQFHGAVHGFSESVVLGQVQHTQIQEATGGQIVQNFWGIVDATVVDHDHLKARATGVVVKGTQASFQHIATVGAGGNDDGDADVLRRDDVGTNVGLDRVGRMVVLFHVFQHVAGVFGRIDHQDGRFFDHRRSLQAGAVEFALEFGGFDVFPKLFEDADLQKQGVLAIGIEGEQGIHLYERCLDLSVADQPFQGRHFVAKLDGGRGFDGFVIVADVADFPSARTYEAQQ